MASISASPSSVVGNSTGNVLTVTGTSTHFTASNPAFQFNNSGGALITNAVIHSDTSATITYNAGLYLGGSSISLVDIATGDGNPSAAVTITKPALGAKNILLIGDSLTAGNGGNGLDFYMLIYFGSVSTSTVTITNRGVNGTSTQDWLQGGSYLVAAVAAGVAAGAVEVWIMLGTNDVRTPNSFTAAQTTANLKLIAAYCLANGIPLVKLNKPPITVPNAGSSGAQWPNDPNSIYSAQWVGNVELTNLSTILAGDSGVFNYSYQDIGAWTSDGVHPTTGNWQLMANMQCIANTGAEVGYPIARGLNVGSGGLLTGGMIEPVAGLGALAGLLRWNPLVRRRFWAAK